MKQRLKSVLGNFEKWNYHYQTKKQAKKIFKNINSEKSIIKQANEYAIEILGHKKYAPWLYVYSAVAGKFKEGWIPDNYFWAEVLPKLKGNYGPLGENKALTQIIFNSNSIPDLFYFVNGLWFDVNLKIVPSQYVDEYLLQNELKFVYKTDQSARGLGVQVISSNKSFKSHKLEKLGNGVIQKFINQHDFFQKITPNSVATLRMTTVLNNSGGFEIRSCFLRLSRLKESHVKFDSNIMIPIDPESGIFDELGILPNWERLNKHPDTDFFFEGQKFPFYEKCKNLVLELHKKIPYVRVIGWDLIINQNNEAQVMEWNGMHNDIKFMEATQGPCFSNLGWENLWKKN